MMNRHLLILHILLAMLAVPVMSEADHHRIIGNNELYLDDFIKLRTEHSTIPDIEDLLILAYSKVATVEYGVRETSDGKPIALVSIRRVNGSVDGIGYDSKEKIARVIIVNHAYLIKEIYPYEYLDGYWKSFNPEKSIYVPR